MSLRRRYLEQQIELGGTEVILAPTVAAPAPPTAAAAVPRGRGAVTDTGAPVGGDVPGQPGWMRDAPPVPGPGLTIELPEPSLLADESAGESLADVAALIADCTRCPLAEGRTNTVPGEGSSEARLMLVGEGPGAREDATGRPFVGAAGELLNGILRAIDIPRESVFIANIVKCRPPKNRKPLPDEVAACLPYLQRQVALIRPSVIVALGGTAAESLLGVKKSLGQLRGQVHSYGGIPLVVTYHPAALLRNPNWKKPTWDDVRIARQLLDR